MRKSVYATAIAAMAGLLFLAAPASAFPFAGGSTAPSAVINNPITQQVSWHCWNTKTYSQKLHRYLRACGDTGKFKHRTSASAGLVVHKKATKATSSY
jgi:hypothetical protein